MRKLFTLLILVFVLNNLFGATYYSIADGNWTNATGTVWSLSSGGTAVSAGTYPKKGDIIYLEGSTIVLDYDLTAQNGIELSIDASSSLTGTGTEGILIKTGGLLQIDGYLEVLNIDLKQGTTVNLTSTGTVKVTDWLTNDAAITIDGSLEIVGLFTNTSNGSITGTGIITAGSYSNSGSIFGITTNPDPGSTIGGATWDGSAGSDWNTATNWANGVVPDNTYNIVITGDGTAPIISGIRSAKAITINSGSVLTIAVGGALTVTEDITNNAGNSGLIIKSSASGSGSLISESGTPPATVESYISQGAWHQVACPTDAGNTSNFYDATNDAWFLKHTESKDEWSYITNIDSIISRNQGFDFWVTTSKTLTFTGNLTKVDQNPVLAYSGSNSDQGWNLLGNPFTSALNWGNPNWGTNDIGTAYVWDGTIGASGDYVSDNGSGGGTLTNGTIPMGQGFFVKATSAGSFTIPKAARFNSNQPFYKSNNNTDPTQYVHLQLNANGHINTVVVGFPENGTEGFDYRGDADKLYSSKDTPQLFAVENDKELCINANAPLTEGESKTVPLHLVQIIDGEYSISISKLDQLENISITLEDVKTNKIQDLREIPVYSFSASSDDKAARFLLHFAWSPSGIEDIEKGSNIQIYSYGKDVYIRSTDQAINQNGDVFIYDLMGRELAQKKIAGTGLTKIPVNTTNNYLVVKVVKNGSIKTKKVYIK